MPRLYLAFALLACGCAHKPPNLVPADVLKTTTNDGWELEVRHFPGDGPPLLLVHGMGANHYNWDYRSDVSPIDELQAQGWDVWVAGMRGDPGSTPPNKGAHNQISFTQHAVQDMPAVVDAVLAETGSEQLTWVGHSMGGMLLYTAMKSYPQKLNAGVALGSPATFTSPNHSQAALRRMGFMIAGSKGRLPMVPMARLGMGLGVMSMLGNKKNLDRPTIRGIARVGLNNMSRATVKEARHWLQERRFCTLDGEDWTAPSDVPILVMGGPKDRIATEPDVAAACAIFSDCRYIKLAESTGFSSDYGHIDPVVGTTAHAEVYPLIFQFLNEHRPDVSTHADER